MDIREKYKQMIEDFDNGISIRAKLLLTLMLCKDKANLTNEEIREYLNHTTDETDDSFRELGIHGYIQGSMDSENRAVRFSDDFMQLIS